MDSLPDRRTTGFTLVEVLVTLAMLVGLIGVLSAVSMAALRHARIAATGALLEAVAGGFERFRMQVGYLPPVLADPGLMPDGSAGAQPGTLGWSRDGVAAPDLPPQGRPDAAPERQAWTPEHLLSVQAWCSTTSVAEYLIGPGDRSQDGFGVVCDTSGSMPAANELPGSREVPALGIRHPGTDGVWGAWSFPRDGLAPDGRFRSRRLAAVTPSGSGDALEANGNARSARQDPLHLVGRPIGPFLDASSLDIGGLAAIGPGGVPTVARPGDAGWKEVLSRVVLDPFGLPVVYYRRPHRAGDPRSIDRRFTLADVVPIRPAAFLPGECVYAAADAAGDPSSTRAAQGAGFAVFSFGPDRRWNPLVRADAEGFNADNIVRFGD